MAYDFYIDDILLPVPPEKLEVKINNQNKTVNLINDGEVNIIKAAGLTDIEFEIRLPNVKYPYAVYEGNFKKAVYYLNKLENLKLKKKFFPFIVSRILPNGKQLFNTDITVSLEEYTITESADDGFDVLVPVKLKQYRDYGIKKLTIKKLYDGTKKTTVEKKRTSDKTCEKTYKVKSGDCLIKIAKQLYGDGNKYKDIYEINKDTIGSNPNRIYPGQILIIP